MTLELRLLQLQTLDPEDFYQKNPQWKTDILGEEVTYVLCPRVQFDRWEKPTELGFVEDKKIYVARSLHPAQIPFVALELFYQGLPRKELEVRLGEDTLKGLSEAKIQRLILQTTLEVAKGYLRAPEMADLLERHTKEGEYRPEEEGEVLRAVALPQSRTIETISLQQRASLDHYVQTMKAYFDAHGRNKYVRRSRAMLAAAKGNAWINKNMDGFIIGADRVLDEIVNDEKLSERMTELTQITTQLAQIQGPTEVIADPIVSRLLYICQEATARRGQRIVAFVGEGPKQGYNRVLVRGPRFFEAVNTRLCQEVIAQKEALEKKVQIIQGPRYQKLLTDGAQKQERVYPEEVQATIEQGIKELSLVATAAANDDLCVARALQARETLKQLGISTDEVDQYIQAYQRGQAEQIAQAAPKRLLR